MASGAEGGEGTSRPSRRSWIVCAAGHDACMIDAVGCRGSSVLLTRDGVILSLCRSSVADWIENDNMGDKLGGGRRWGSSDGGNWQAHEPNAKNEKQEVGGKEVVSVRNRSPLPSSERQKAWGGSGGQAGKLDKLQGRQGHILPPIPPICMLII